MGRLGTDIGGTFTDLVHFDENTGQLRVAKALTTASDLTEGLIDAITHSGISAEGVTYFVHGGTTVINAITERKGVRTALVTTAGFRDVLEIARGNRPDLYNLRFEKEMPFVPRELRFEVRERIGPNGQKLEPLNLDDLERVARDCRAAGVEAIAIVFLHCYAEPAHEIAAAEHLGRLLPDVPITASHTITREWREYERSNTAVLNAYVQPIIRQYLDRLGHRLGGAGYDCPLQVMQSNGGTASFRWAREHPITLIESGPAAGVNGAVLISRLCEEPNVIYLDIGGTTAKCSTIRDYQVSITTEYKLEWTRRNFGYPVRTPTVDIVEIGAGGGSIAWFDAAGLLRVGPVSAGGDPGPACYGRGGIDPTVTDAKLLTGVINPENFAIGQFRLDRARAETAMQRIADGLRCSIDDAAISVIRLVDANMINALKLVSIQRGHDPREFSLVVGGGGGGMHAAKLAREIGVKEVIVPLHPGLFSAWGMLASEQRRDFVLSRLSIVRDTPMTEVRSVFADMLAAAREEFAFEAGLDAPDLDFSAMIDLRYLGQEHAVTVPLDLAEADIELILEAFHQLHEQTYTFRLSDTEVEFVTYRLKAAARGPRPEIAPLSSEGRSRALAERPSREVNFGEEGRHLTAIFDRDRLPPGFVEHGPAIIEEPTSTTMVLPDQRVEVDTFGFLRIREAACP